MVVMGQDHTNWSVWSADSPRARPERPTDAASRDPSSHLLRRRRVRIASPVPVRLVRRGRGRGRGPDDEAGAGRRHRRAQRLLAAGSVRSSPAPQACVFVDVDPIDPPGGSPRATSRQASSSPAVWGLSERSSTAASTPGHAPSPGHRRQAPLRRPGSRHAPRPHRPHHHRARQRGAHLHPPVLTTTRTVGP